MNDPTGTFAKVDVDDPKTAVIAVGSVNVTISFVEVDYNGKKSDDGSYITPKDLFPYEYGTLSGNTVAATGNNTDAWHYAVVTANTYAWDGSATSGLNISNYQTYKTYVMIATVDAATPDQVAGFKTAQSSVITLTPDDAKTGLWTAENPCGDLVHAPVTGTGHNQRTLTVSALSETSQTIEFGYVMVYAHGAEITTDCKVGFSVGATTFGA